MKPSGHIFYQDEYSTVYDVVWFTIGGVLDFTSTVNQPFVWGELDSGYQRQGVLFRRGIVTITRQIIRPFTGGYEIVAEGVSQYEDDIQVNFPCQPGPTDPFAYHLDHPVVDDTIIIMSDGPRWADPDEDADDDMVWGDLDGGGSPVAISGTPLSFIDVWG